MNPSGKRRARQRGLGEPEKRKVKCPTCGLWFDEDALRRHKYYCKKKSALAVVQKPAASLDSLLQEAMNRLTARCREVEAELARFDELKEELSQLKKKIAALSELLPKAEVLP